MPLSFDVLSFNAVLIWFAFGFCIAAGAALACAVVSEAWRRLVRFL
jgi:hypothetical protein